MPYSSGGALALGRLLFGTALLALVMIRSRWVVPTGREWTLIVLFGVAWFGAYNVAPNIAVQTLDAVPTALAFSTWAYALARVPAGQLGVSTYVVPPVAILLGLLVFDEIPGPLAIAGGALCLLGVGLSRRRGGGFVRPPVT